ncbi:MAG: hypothetical protein ACLFQV_03820 [Vulcanimicrobiota bacterium]
MAFDFTASVIEVGTNSVKLLVAGVKNNKPVSLVYTRKITRLGESMGRTRILTPQAIERTVRAIKDYEKQSLALGAEKIAIVATEALRVAENSGEFKSRVEKDTGLTVEILSGREEACASRKGALLDFENNNPVIILDIGGGSTEFAAEEWEVTIPMGAVSLTEKFFAHDPPESTEIQETRKFIRKKLKGALKDRKLKKNVKLIGVGGTMTTTAGYIQKMDCFEPERIHKFKITRKKLKETIEKLIQLDIINRKKVLAIDPGRADIIPAGLLILEAAFNYFEINEIVVSIKNIIHGIFYEKFLE